MLGRLLALPLDVVGALRTVPAIARDTNRMADATTTSLPALEREITRVAEATEAIATMDARMATIADAMPVLVDVQRQLSALPETIERLDARIAELSVLLAGLQDSLTPLGRIAKRLPGQRSTRDAG